MYMIKFEKLKFISLLLFSMLILSMARITIKDTERQFILDVINVFRYKFASGDYGINLTLSNMNVLNYDLDLEEFSSQLQIECALPETYNEMLFNEKLKVIVISDTILKEIMKTKNPRINSIVSGYCSDVSCFYMMQMLDPRSSRIGCSLKYCQKSVILVCSLDKGSVFSLKEKDKFMYGRPCTRCSPHFSYCFNGNLCASKSQCLRSRNNKCINTCVDSNLYCRQFSHFCNSNSTDWLKFMNKMCPQQCGLCKEAVPSVNTGSQLINVGLIKSAIKKKKMIQCFNSIWICYRLFNENVCHLPTIANNCQDSCRSCMNDEFWIKFYREKMIQMQNEGLPQQQSRCHDQRKECVRWANNNYCYMPIVQLYCPRVCAICPTSPITQQVTCHEDEPRKKVCKEIWNKNLCYAPDLKILCPMTCGNTKCGPPLRTTTLRDECMEPQSRKDVCETFRSVGYCQKKDISAFCPQTCVAKQCIRTTTPNTLPVFVSDPPICESVREYCYNPAINQYCRITCNNTKPQIKSTTSIPLKIDRLTSTTDVCSGLINLCNNPGVKRMCSEMCKKKSQSSSTLLPITRSSPNPTITKTLTRETSTLETSTLEMSTPKTSTSETSTLETSTRETSTLETSTLETPTRETSTLETSTLETSTRETPTRETSTLETSTRETPTRETSTRETPTRETSTLETSTRETPTRETSTLETSTPKRDPEFCIGMEWCNNYEIQKSCPITCGKVTSTERTATESLFCDERANCLNWQIRKHCWKTCSKKVTAPTTEVQRVTEHSNCKGLKENCNSSIKKYCPITCGDSYFGI